MCQVTADYFPAPEDAVELMNRLAEQLVRGNISSANKGLYTERDKILSEDRFGPARLAPNIPQKTWLR